MEARAVSLLKFLKNSTQFIIPIYQRTYSWTEEQCKQLWLDIERVATDEKLNGHFVGSIVYVEQGLYKVSDTPRLLVIDGQQRLTTITLLLVALGNLIEESDLDIELTRRKIDNYYLFNTEETDDLKYRLMLTRGDKDTLINLVERRETPDNASSRLIENYEFFFEQIKKSKLEPAQIYNGLSKLLVVDIALDRDNDNPQLIFESLNSTGLELSQADLIRNYVLMSLEPEEQTRLYETYWSRMEDKFGREQYSEKFDSFMRDYLTIKSGTIPRIKDVYEEFKRHAASLDLDSIEPLLEDVYEYSRYYVRLALERDEDPELNEAFHDINSLKVDVAYPFILTLLNDYDNGSLQRSELLTALRTIESYVFRRAICGIPTNSLNKTFATLPKAVDKERYLESIQATLLTKTSYRRYPNNSEFINELAVKDIYNFARRNYLLRKLENHERKEKVSVEEYTIEHVLPQNENLSHEWRDELGPDWQEVQATYLHTLGNLTLTGYNSELSDRPFSVKKSLEGGFADSPIRLNASIAKAETWNKEEIIGRGKMLARKAAEIWGYPEYSEEVLSNYKTKKTRGTQKVYTLEDHPLIAGQTKALFDELTKRVLNLDSSIVQVIKKRHIGFQSSPDQDDSDEEMPKRGFNIIYVNPRKSRLRITICMRLEDINDPKGVCQKADSRNWPHMFVENIEQLDYAMSLIKQSCEEHLE